MAAECWEVAIQHLPEYFLSTYEGANQLQGYQMVRVA
jgi:hypothetical protein